MHLLLVVMIISFYVYFPLAACFFIATHMFVLESEFIFIISYTFKWCFSDIDEWFFEVKEYNYSQNATFQTVPFRIPSVVLCSIYMKYMMIVVTINGTMHRKLTSI